MVSDVKSEVLGSVQGQTPLLKGTGGTKVPEGDCGKSVGGFCDCGVVKPMQVFGGDIEV